jgi:hypothetical protein
LPRRLVTPIEAKRRSRTPSREVATEAEALAFVKTKDLTPIEAFSFAPYSMPFAPCSMLILSCFSLFACPVADPEARKAGSKGAQSKGVFVIIFFALFIKAKKAGSLFPTPCPVVREECPV